MIGLVAPLLLGLALAALLAPPARGAPARLLALALALPLGLGAASLLRFAWLLGPGPEASGFVALELALAASLAGAAGWLWRPGAALAPPASTPGAPPWVWGLTAAVALAALAGLVAFALTHPFGRWDAWMIWNLRARFLVRAGDDWRVALSPFLPWSHPDYPLGLPLVVETLWRALGREAIAAPIGVAIGYTLATAGVLGAAAAVVRGAWAAPPAVALLLGAGELLKQGASQYADVPLGCLFLSGVVALALHARAAASPGEEGRRWLVVAGAAAGLAAWTKNEGLLFAAALPAGHLVAGRRRGARALARELAWLALGALPAAAALLWFKTHLAPPNDLVAGQGLHATLGRAVDPARWGTILGFLARHALKLPVYLLAGWLALTGLAPGARRDPALQAALVVLALLGLGYLAVYLVTPLPLEWHLDSSLSRLLVQLWPCAVWAGVLAARSPGDAAAEAEAEARSALGESGAATRAA